jgi:hypothetical protein
MARAAGIRARAGAPERDNTAYKRRMLAPTRLMSVP